MFNEPSFHNQPGEVGLDVGYLSTKYALRRDGKIVTGSFPSLALRASGVAIFSGLESIGAREADLRIEIGDASYLVNTSEVEVVSSSVIRTENDQYPITDEHDALVKAALVQSGIQNISELVLGLPMHTFQQYAPALIKKFRGRHEFGHGTYTVRNASVLPQGVGAFAFLRVKKPDAFMPDTSCCMIDCGWATTDTLVASPSFKIDPHRSRGIAGGAALVLRHIAELLQRDHSGRFSNLDRIDRAIVTGKPLIHAGREIDLSPYLRRALHVTIPVARSVLTTIKTQEDLIVFAAGGAAHYYLEALREILGCEIQVVDNPRFANSIGFLLAGEAARKGRQ
ncbi:plasmid segregation protein ParM [Paraburkholderia steynii]|uniref:Plasmid segregation protein ParM n=1 Tax=Paraburkholderia steynii TaxID=1245441 RepID=A0A7Z7B4I5_9BURK|nr:ParM/StbA family protein [Paraburkholderia steynii]SDH56259.1 plasmid segregation protein ParM [Paraburkholderia steynii]